MLAASQPPEYCNLFPFGQETRLDVLVDAANHSFAPPFVMCTVLYMRRAGLGGATPKKPPRSTVLYRNAFDPLEFPNRGNHPIGRPPCYFDTRCWLLKPSNRPPCTFRPHLGLFFLFCFSLFPRFRSPLSLQLCTCDILCSYPLPPLPRFLCLSVPSLSLSLALTLSLPLCLPPTFPMMVRPMPPGIRQALGRAPECFARCVSPSLL